MTPKQLLNKMAEEAVDEIGKARYEGALAMYECYLDKQRRYYETHREYHREYQRNYKRSRRAKQPDMSVEETIMKEVESIK